MDDLNTQNFLDIQTIFSGMDCYLSLLRIIIGVS